MIGSEISIRYEGSRKIREGKGNDLRRDTEGHRGIIKCFHCAVDLRQQICLCSSRWAPVIHLIEMRVEAAERAEKKLAVHPKRFSQADELGDLFQLVAETGSRI